MDDSSRRKINTLKASYSESLNETESLKEIHSKYKDLEKVVNRQSMELNSKSNEIKNLKQQIKVNETGKIDKTSDNEKSKEIKLLEKY